MSVPFEGDAKIGGVQLASGQTLMERYVIEERLGSGGWSEVYKARDLSGNRSVAIKILYPHLSWNPDSVVRFQQEAALIGRINHENVVTVFDSGVLPDGAAYIIMELLEGKTLKQVLTEDGPMDEAFALPLGVQILNGLIAAHGAGIIHRDLKPANVFLATTSGGEQKATILDFGLAKLNVTEGENSLTTTGETLGSPSYMSPEHCMGKAVDARSDIYSFGCLIYEVLSGRTPFQGNTPFELMLRHIKRSAQPVSAIVDVSEPIEILVMQCLAKKPDDRPQSAAALKVQIQKALQEGGTRKISARRSRESRTRLKVFAVSLFALVALVGSCFLINQVEQADARDLGPFFLGTNGVLRPPGFTSLLPGERVLTARKGVLWRQCNSSLSSDGDQTFLYSGLVLDSSAKRLEFFNGSETIDADGELQSLSVVYGNQGIAVRCPTTDRGSVDLPTVKAMKVTHRADGWLQTFALTIDGKVHGFLTDETGVTKVFSDLRGYGEGDVNLSQLQMPRFMDKLTLNDVGTAGGEYIYIDPSGKTVLRLSEIIDSPVLFAASFVSGLARVRISDGWLFIDKKGRRVISCPPSVIEASDFSYNRARIKTSSGFGYLDYAGKLVIPPIFKSADHFSEGVACVSASVGNFQLIDTEGRVLTALPGEASQFREGRASVVLDGKVGVIDKAGKFIVPPRFDRIGGFSEGKAFAESSSKSFRIERDGKVQGPFPLSVVGNVSDGLIKFARGRHYGFASTDMRVVVSAKFDDASEFNDGMACVVRLGKTSYIDKLGMTVIVPRYYIGSQFCEGMAAVKQYGMVKFINRRGKTVIQPEYTWAQPFSEGLACVKKPTKVNGYPIQYKYPNVSPPLPLSKERLVE